MRRIIAIILLGTAGCSTAPVADFLDWTAPGGPPGLDPEPLQTGPRIPVDEWPPSGDFPRDGRNDAPPLPPVPGDYTPRSTAPDVPAARLLPKPTT